LHRLVHVEGFMLVLLATLPFTIDGTPMIAIGPLAASQEGILRAVTILLKVTVSVLTVFGLLGSLDPVRLGCAAARLGIPHKLVHLFLFLTRYLGVLRAECGRLVDAMRIRGFVAGSNLHTWRSLGNLAGMLLVRSIERAERVDEAMRCRAFSGRFHVFATGRFGMRDLIFAVAFTLALLLLLVVDRAR
jgi:cobalt/nickel transport system permease protein